jgi:hypothetical protein
MITGTHVPNRDPFGKLRAAVAPQGDGDGFKTSESVLSGFYAQMML